MRRATNMCWENRGLQRIRHASNENAREKKNTKICSNYTKVSLTLTRQLNALICNAKNKKKKKNL